MVVIKKSDWIKFKAVKKQALEKFCTNALAEFEATIHDESLSKHERYLKLYSSVQETDKKLGQIFNGLSRSRASWQMMMIRAEGLVEDEALEEMSEAFREQSTQIRWEDN
ncbi:MAG TPA: hypothetical protein ENI98_03435 [Gammaproteobacteria bacterium]|nr:hypothetical protein [Gammaproteobacteria bacterium]